MSTFTGFSEEDLYRMKTVETSSNGDIYKTKNNLGYKPDKNLQNKISAPDTMKRQNSDDTFYSMFDKCKLSLNSSSVGEVMNTSMEDITLNNNNTEDKSVNNSVENVFDKFDDKKTSTKESRKSSVVTPDLKVVTRTFTEENFAASKVKLEELQLQQKLMEELNNKRKEMLAKALADRTRQTEEEVQKLDKIKKELQIIDGQFSQEVAVLRKKIDQACFSYADAEKQYLRVEKEFLQAKLNLQKEREKKELLTEHLCALVTHNEARKATKLETLMAELATATVYPTPSAEEKETQQAVSSDEDEPPVVIHGVDQRSGKMVMLPSQVVGQGDS